MPRRWDDWRCYRCMRWFPVDARRIEHETPAGHTVGVCLECVRATVAPAEPDTLNDLRK